MKNTSKADEAVYLDDISNQEQKKSCPCEQLFSDFVFESSAFLQQPKVILELPTRNYISII